MTTKTLGPFLLFLLLGLVIGSVAWGIRRTSRQRRGTLPLFYPSAPTVFDLRVLAVWVRLNPGSLLGAAGESSSGGAYDPFDAQVMEAAGKARRPTYPLRHDADHGKLVLASSSSQEKRDPQTDGTLLLR
jgi:hypothetical protein